VLRLAGGFKGGSPSNQPGWRSVLDRAAVTVWSRPEPRRRAETSSSRSWAASMDLGRFVGTPTAVLANRGMGLWYSCTIDGNFRIAQSVPYSPNRAAAEPADRTSGDQEGHRVAPPPGGVKGPSLWPSTLKRRCPCCTLAAHGHRATSCPPLDPRGWRSRWLLLARNAGRAVGVPREAGGRGAPFPGALRDGPSARGSGFPAKLAQAAAPGRHPLAPGPQRNGGRRIVPRS